MQPDDIVRIDAPDDTRLAAYRDIRERDLVGRQERFVAEGKVVLRLLLQSRFETESILVLENRLAGLAQLLAERPAGVPVYAAGRRVIDTVAGFPVHRGILAIGRRRTPDDPDALLRTCAPPATAIALVGLTNHDNMGAIFRNAAAFGAGCVLLDDTCCDPLYRKAIRVSVGAALKVPFARAGTAGHMLALLDAAGFGTVALSPGAERDIGDIRHPGRLALVLGTEGEGLPPDLIEDMSSARIAMAADFDSLNVATAGAVALHHFYRQAHLRD